MSVHFVDKTLNQVHATKDYSTPHTAIMWAMSQFRLTYDWTEPDRALIHGILIEKRKDDGYDMQIRAEFEGTEQLYEGTVFPGGGSGSFGVFELENRIDILQERIAELENNSITRSDLDASLMDVRREFEDTIDESDAESLFERLIERVEVRFG